jgi:hypothetical protein
MSDRSEKQTVTDYYLVLAKVGERLSVSKQTMHIFHTEKFSMKKLNEVEDLDLTLVYA